MKKTTLAIGLCATILSSGIAACSTSGNSSKSQTPTKGSKQATSSNTNQAAPAAKQELNYGGIGAQPVQDPHGALFNEVDWVRLRAIYGTLIATDNEGKRIGGLAESMTPNEDASEWTLKITKGATFSDQSPVTADDVLYTLQRLDKKKAENGMRLATIDVSKSTKVDDATITLATTTPDADLPRALSGMVFVVKKGQDSFDKHIGAGPFTVQKTSAQAISLAKRTNYWGNAPKLDKITIYSFANPKALVQGLTSKKIHVAAAVPSGVGATLERDKNTKVIKRAGAVAAPLLMRVDKGPFAKAKVRQAVKIALDREAMVKTVFSGFGETGKDMMKLTDPSVPTGAPAIKQDVTKAKELLAEAGATNLKVTLHTTNAYPAMKATATVAKEQLKEVGIDVTIKEHDPTKYWSKAYTVEPFTVGYWVDTPFATTIRQTTLSTSGFSETGWKNKQFDTDFAAAMAMTDSAKRNDSLGKLHKTMAQEGGWAVWGFGDHLTATNRRVTGLNTKYNTHDLTGVSLSAS